MKRFNNLYGRPVIPFYRTTLYELVQVRVLPSLPPYLPPFSPGSVILWPSLPPLLPP